MTELTTWAYRPSFVCWVPDAEDDEYPYSHAHSGGDCDWGWICNADGCDFRTDMVPCTKHAPMQFPGLRLVECQAEPPHLLWAHDCDDYGHGCPQCWADQNFDELHALKVATHRFRHGAWRRWKVSSRVMSLLHLVGIVRGHAWVHGDGCRGCIDSITWRWKR